MPFLTSLHAALPPLCRVAGREASGAARTSEVVLPRWHVSVAIPRDATIDKLPRNETSFQKSRRVHQYAMQEGYREQDAVSDATVNVLSSRARVSELKPLPFQTLHPSVSHLQGLAHQASSGQPVVQLDWLEDGDDVSGRASEIVLALRGSGDGGRSPIEIATRVNGDVPHVNIEEALDDASVDDLSMDHLSQDYVQAAYAWQPFDRNKVSDHDYGYGDLRARQCEELKAKQIPYIDPAEAKRQCPTNVYEHLAVPEFIGPTDELSFIDDEGILSDHAQVAGTGGYRTGLHQISLGLAALRARFTEGAEQDVWATPGADGFGKR